MAYKALKANGLPFELIRAEDIKKGRLKNYAMLFVPGGWASNKIKALGGKGLSEIKKFVRSGGNYLGFCGGAGLATLDGIGLLNVKRKPTKERVPSFSGRIHLNINKHPIFTDSPIHRFTHSPVFHAWWPSQFLTPPAPPLNKGGYRGGIKKLATYGDAMPDSFSSDLNVGDVETNNNWTELEEIYGINLNPKRLKDEPAVIEGGFGKGRVILSLIHFDTPDDANGAMVLRNLWEYLVPNAECGMRNAENAPSYPPLKIRGGRESYETRELEWAVEDLIDLGLRNFLWFWRNPMLLQWRRGVRGLEYCTLYVMIKELVKILKMHDAGYMIQDIEKDLKKIKGMLLPFTEKAKQLLILERHALQNGHITPLSPPLLRGGWGGYDPAIQKIRIELFGDSKSHGGLFKELIDEVDKLLFSLIHS